MKPLRLSSADFQAMDSRYRATLANSLTGFKAANLIGSYNTDNGSNLAIMSSAVHLGSHPPLIALVVRPDSAERHTLRNIVNTGFYSLNHIAEGFVPQAHQTAARYPDNISEFDAVGLTEQWEEDFPCPFVAESPIKLGLQLREHHHLSINDTNLIIGEVVLALLPGDSVATDGALDLNLVKTMTISGLDTYHRPQQQQRMAYAKPDASPQQLDAHTR
jgi:flavin reductase (DIM6/NTAB) family NADH-FMN oxidoreductase RutF